MRKGNVVSHYRIEEKIGEGGMGEVFIAFDETLQRRVALKSIRPAHVLDPQTRGRFLREARILSQLDHAHICRIHDYVEGTDGDYLVLELIDGESLAHHIPRGTERARALEIAEEIADALVAAHGAGVVHRDLKPANVMLTAEGTVKVLDFGLARSEDAPPAQRDAADPGEAAQEEGQGFRTEHGRLLGTPQYMSPEQALGESATTASDVYSLGLLFQELFTGRPAVDPSLSFEEVFFNASLAKTLAPAGLSEDLTRLVESMKSPAPSHRPTAVDVAERLRWIRGKPGRRARRLVAGVIVLVFVLFGVKYVIDLGQARAVAEERRAKAEELNGFMLDHLYWKLEPLGLTAILGDVNEEASAYFTSVPEEELSPDDALRRSLHLVQAGRIARDEGDLERARASFEEALEVASRPYAGDTRNALAGVRRMQAAYELGDVHLDQGNLADAREALEASLAEATALLEADPRDEHGLSGQCRAEHKLGELSIHVGDPEGAAAAFAAARSRAEELHTARPDASEWLFVLGQSHFWTGYLEWQAGALETALERFRDYLAVSQELALLQPYNRKWQVEVAYAHTNVGAVHHERGESAAAIEAFESVVATWRALTAYDPANSDWQRELADALSWLSSAYEQRGSLEEAERLVEEELALRRELVARDASNGEWQYLHSIAWVHLGAIREAGGDSEGAHQAFLSGVDEAEALAVLELGNLEWQRNLAVAHMRLGRTLRRLGRLQEARAPLEAGLTLLERIHATDSRNADWLDMLALCTIDVGKLLLAEGRRGEALATAREARARAEELSELDPGATRRTRLTGCHADLLLGRACSENDLSAEARTAWLAVLAASAELAEGSFDPEIQTVRAMALLHLDRREEARATVADLVDRGFHDPDLRGLCTLNGLDIPVEPRTNHEDPGGGQ